MRWEELLIWNEASSWKYPTSSLFLLWGRAECSDGLMDGSSPCCLLMACFQTEPTTLLLKMELGPLSSWALLCHAGVTRAPVDPQEHFSVIPGSEISSNLEYEEEEELRLQWSDSWSVFSCKGLFSMLLGLSWRSNHSTFRNVIFDYFFLPTVQMDLSDPWNPSDTVTHELSRSTVLLYGLGGLRSHLIG